MTETEQQLRALYQDSVGTVEDQEALSMLQFDALETPTYQCMTKAGYSPVFPRYTKSYAGVDSIYPDFLDAVIPVDDTFVKNEGLGRGPVVSRAVAEGYTPPAPQDNPSYDSMSSDDQAKYNQELSACTPESSKFEGAGTPQLSTTLTSALIRTVQDVLAKDSAYQDLVAAYASCMKDQGFDAKNRSQLAEEIYSEYADIEQTQPLSKAVASDAWQAEAERELAAADADASCRASAHDEALRALAAPLQDFAAEHSSELQELSDQWTQVRADAAAAASQWPGQ